MSDTDDLLTTNQLIDRIEEEFGLRYDRNTITAWTRRDDDPLPVSYRGRPGQGHKYDWMDFLQWFERETTRQDRAADDRGQIDVVDFHEARTIDMRERAKRSIIETAEKAGKYGEVAQMRAAAEDLARQAVQMLLNIPARVSPKIAVLTDEVEIDNLLQEELRVVCNMIAELQITHSPDSVSGA